MLRLAGFDPKVRLIRLRPHRDHGGRPTPGRKRNDMKMKKRINGGRIIFLNGKMIKCDPLNLWNTANLLRALLR